MACKITTVKAANGNESNLYKGLLSHFSNPGVATKVYMAALTSKDKFTQDSNGEPTVQEVIDTALINWFMPETLDLSLEEFEQQLYFPNLLTAFNNRAIELNNGIGKINYILNSDTDRLKKASLTNDLEKFQKMLREVKKNADALADINNFEQLGKIADNDLINVENILQNPKATTTELLYAVRVAETWLYPELHIVDERFKHNENLQYGYRLANGKPEMTTDKFGIERPRFVGLQEYKKNFDAQYNKLLKRIQGLVESRIKEQFNGALDVFKVEDATGQTVMITKDRKAADDFVNSKFNKNELTIVPVNSLIDYFKVAEDVSIIESELFDISRVDNKVLQSLYVWYIDEQERTRKQAIESLNTFEHIDKKLKSALKLEGKSPEQFFESLRENRNLSHIKDHQISTYNLAITSKVKFLVDLLTNELGRTPTQDEIYTVSPEELHTRRANYNPNYKLRPAFRDAIINTRDAIKGINKLLDIVKRIDGSKMYKTNNLVRKENITFYENLSILFKDIMSARGANHVAAHNAYVDFVEQNTIVLNPLLLANRKTLIGFDGLELDEMDYGGDDLAELKQRHIDEIKQAYGLISYPHIIKKMQDKLDIYYRKFEDKKLAIQNKLDAAASGDFVYSREIANIELQHWVSLNSPFNFAQLDTRGYRKSDLKRFEVEVDGYVYKVMPHDSLVDEYYVEIYDAEEFKNDPNPFYKKRLDSNTQRKVLAKNLPFEVKSLIKGKAYTNTGIYNIKIPRRNQVEKRSIKLQQGNIIVEVQTGNRIIAYTQDSKGNRTYKKPPRLDSLPFEVQDKIRDPKFIMDAKDNGVKLNYYNKAFEEVERNPTYYEWYMFLTNTMSHVNMIMPDNVKHRMYENTVPMISKTLLEQIASTKGVSASSKVMFDYIKENLRSKEQVTSANEAKYLNTNFYSGVDEEVRTLMNMRNREALLAQILAESDVNPVINDINDIHNDAALRTLLNTAVVDQVIGTKSFDLSRLLQLMIVQSEIYTGKLMVEDMVRSTNVILKNVEQVPKSNIGNSRRNPITKVESPVGLSDSFKNMKAMFGNFENKFYGITNDTMWVGKKRKYTPEDLQKKEELDKQLKSLKELYDVGKISKEIYNGTGERIQQQLDRLGYFDDYVKRMDAIMEYIKFKNMAYNTWAPWSNMAFGMIENYGRAADGRSFRFHHLNKAYKTVVHSIVKGVGATTPTGKKIAALMEAYDMEQRSTEEIYSGGLVDSIGSKLPNKLSPYKMQSSGEFLNVAPLMLAYLYANKVEVTVNGNKTKVDLFTLFNEKGALDSKYKYDGDLEALMREHFTKIKQLRDITHGNYNADKKIKAKDTVWGRGLLMFRSWMPEAFAQRYQRQQNDLILGYDLKGKYRALKDVVAGDAGLSPLKAVIFTAYQLGRKWTFAQKWSKDEFATQFHKTGVFMGETYSFSEADAASMRSALHEVTILIGLIMAGLVLRSLAGDMDDDEKYKVNYFINHFHRLQTDVLMYSDPAAFESIARNSVPVTAVLTDVWRVVKGAWTIITREEGETAPGLYGGHEFGKAMLQAFPITKELITNYTMFNTTQMR